MAIHNTRRTSATGRLVDAIIDVHHAQQRLFDNIRLDRVGGNGSAARH